MQKTILITGATDGIGLETAKLLASQGHNILAHGRSEAKLTIAMDAISSVASGAAPEPYLADLSRIGDVETLAEAIAKDHVNVDVLINNAGIFKTTNPITDDGLDVRFVVNTFAPYLLTKLLLPYISADGRVVNLSSAAQAPVNIKAMQGETELAAFDAYAQSKLAITMWTRHMSANLGSAGPLVVSVNPGSLLASKMVKEGFGVAGNDISIGVDILTRAALSDEFNGKGGAYFDNDAGTFAEPHIDALNESKVAEVVASIEATIATLQRQ